MRIIFVGTPAFAVPYLQALLDAQYDVCAVYTQPDRRAGRGRHLEQSPIKQLALSHNLPVHQPQTLRDPEEQSTLAALNADVMVVVAYGLLLPSVVLTAPRLGCLNVHASLLPRWRGAAPMQYALLQGDRDTGVTIMQMTEGLDAGDMLLKIACPIAADDTAKSLHDKLAPLGVQALLEVLAAFQQGKVHGEVQDDTLVTLAPKIKKSDALIDWQQSAIILERCVRAYNPWPVAYTQRGEQRVRVWQAHVLAQSTDAPPGTILNADQKGIDVATGDGVLQLQRLQLPGRKPLAVADLLNAHHDDFSVGECFA